MNEGNGTLDKMSNFAKNGPNKKLMMFLIPGILLSFLIIYAALDSEISMEAVDCLYVKNCDNSVETKETSAIDKKEAIQQNYQVHLASAKKNEVGTVTLVEGLPHQKSTNQPITDTEFEGLAKRMKDGRLELPELAEDAEEYETIGDNAGGSIGNIDTTDMDHWEMALEASKHTGWHPLFIMSQWQLETGHFKSNNFKQNNNVAGQTWYPGSKYPKGTARPSAEGGWYIKYPDPVTGYVDFVNNNSRYNKVKTFDTPEEQAREVARQGWAVDPNYANKLINMIEKNRKTYGDVTVPVGGGEETNPNPPGDDAGTKDGDKVVAEAYRMLETRGLGSSNPIKYSMDKRAQEAYGDCSEFTMMVYKKALGVDIGYTTIGQIEKNAEFFSTDKSQIQPGDLVYFNNPGGHAHKRVINGQTIEVDHTGIYVGDNKFIDLSSSVGTISLKDMGPGGKYETYFNQSFIGFIRLGEPGTGGGVMSSIGTYDEAEVHIRALANTDWYAVDESNLFVIENGKLQFEKYEGEDIPKLKEEFEGTNVQEAYYVAVEMEKDTGDKLMFNYVGEERAKDWAYRDWILNTQLVAYNCYLLGNETEMDKDGVTGFWEWVGNIFGSVGPCEQLDEYLYTALNNRGELDGKSKDEVQYIEEKDRGVLKQYYTKKEYTYTCNPPPPPPPPKEEDESDDGSDGDSGGTDDGGSVPPVHKGPGGPLEASGKIVGNLTLVEAINRPDLNIEVGKGVHNCDYGVKDTIIETTNYPVYPSLYSGEANKSVLKSFEKYSLVIPGKNTGSEEDFIAELNRILRLFYGDELDSNEAMIQTVGGGVDFIVPMEDGTYNYASAFRSSGRPDHNGVDMGTLGVSGVPIYASSNGKVVSTGWVNGYGYTVMIEQDNGYYSFYAHMLEDYIVVEKGQTVRQAQLIGGVDGVPNLAKHLHFEVCERSIVSQSGNLMCQDWVDPEEDDNGADGKEDDAKLSFNKTQDMNKSNKMATKFLSEWKESAKKGKVYIMPGYASVTGSLSESFENKDGGCVDNEGDDGGMSCGFYQFANNRGKVCEFVNWLGKNTYDDYYNYLSPFCANGVERVSQTAGFMTRWHELKKDGKYPEDFKNAQYIYIKSKHYDPVANTIYSQFGLNVNERHVAVQEMIWSIGVQQPGHAPDMFRTAGFSKSTNWDKVTDKEIIEKIYTVRHDKVPQYFSSSPSLWDSLRNRFITEKAKALAMLGQG